MKYWKLISSTLERILKKCIYGKERLIKHSFYIVVTCSPSFLQLNDIIVSTPGTAMQMYLLETLLLQDKPLLFVGPTGTGKTAITNSFLQHLPQEKYAVCQINFSVQASANQTQDIFLTKLERYPDF